MPVTITPKLSDVVQANTNDVDKAQFRQFAIGLEAYLASAREVLTAPRTYYVRTDGSNANNGLTNTAGGAFATLQKAVDTVAALDISTFSVTVQAADGTHAPVTLRDPVGTGTCTLRGNTVAPANCIISGGTYCIQSPSSSMWTVTGFRVTGTSGFGALSAIALITVGVIDLASCTSTHLSVTNNGAIDAAGATLNVTGNSGVHLYAERGGAIRTNFATVTFSAGVTFSQTAYVTEQARVSAFSVTYSGTPTAQRYVLSRQAMLITNGASLPGTTAGSQDASSFFV